MDPRMVPDQMFLVGPDLDCQTATSAKTTVTPAAMSNWVVVKLFEACDPVSSYSSSVLAFFVADDEGQVGGLRLQ